MSEKRNLFDELMQGMAAMREHRRGKIALRASGTEDAPPPATQTAWPHTPHAESEGGDAETIF